MIDTDRFRSEEDSATTVDGSATTVIDTTPACCRPVPCGWYVGADRRTFREQQQDWDEEVRGWSGL